MKKRSGCKNYFGSLGVAILVTLLILCSSTLAASNFSFVNYTEELPDEYVYYTDELGTNYSSNFQNYFCSDGEKWSMETSVQAISLNELGGLEITGTTILQNKSLLAGFTGGSFINIFDKNKTPLYLASTKSGLPLGSIDIDRDIAKEVGWGVNPGKAELYIAGYVKKKIAWWTVKLPIIKSRIVPKTREVTWSLEIPSYILDKEIYIEILNSHTPSYRVIEALETAGEITYSFVLRCGLSTAFLYIEISRGAFDYSDFERYCCTVLDWAADEDLLDDSKSINVQNIIIAIGELVETYKYGLDVQDQLELVSIGYNLVAMISNKSFDIDSLSSFISSLESLLFDSDGNIISGTFEQVEVILRNLQPLLNLSEEQEEAYDSVVDVFYFINNLDFENSNTGKIICSTLNGLELVLDIYNKVKKNQITIENAEELINEWLNQLGLIINTSAPEYYDEFCEYKNTLSNTLVKILIFADEVNWL